MTATALDTYHLTTAGGLRLGTLVADERRGNLVLGEFTPGDDYPEVSRHFLYFEELVNDQVLSLTDQAADVIDGLGIRAAVAGGDPVRVTDVQLYSDGGGSFRLPAAADRNGAGAH